MAGPSSDVASKKFFRDKSESRRDPYVIVITPKIIATPPK
jgi:hypothetical protein